MKKAVFAVGAILLAGTALSGNAAFAGQNDDLVARLNAADQENAALRKQAADLATAKPAASPSFSDRISDFMGSYAADLPVAYKAPPPVTPGVLTFWGEGGAIWTGGDKVARSFELNDFTSVGLTHNTGTVPGIFNLDPKIGWTGAAGFDYKFANSPWHVNGQFRYGQGGDVSASATSAGALDPSALSFVNANSNGCLLPVIGNSFTGSTDPAASPAITACGGSQSRATTYKETHWLSDLALGYDIVSGPSYVQVKGGLRIEEFVATRTTSASQANFVNFSGPVTFVDPGNFLIVASAVGGNFSGTFNNRADALGAGPLLGLEGSARFMGAWSFDYKGDLAVLFGTQADFRSGAGTTTVTPTALGLFNSNIGGFSYANTDRRFVTMLSPDIQVGFSYWFNPNWKLGVSYRVDALIAVKNSKSTNADDLLLPQRYWHGPLLTLTGQFASN